MNISITNIKINSISGIGSLNIGHSIFSHNKNSETTVSTTSDQQAASPAQTSSVPPEATPTSEGISPSPSPSPGSGPSPGP